MEGTTNIERTLHGLPVSALQDNIRALLSTLHTVLWANSGWKPPGLTDLVETAKVRCFEGFACILPSLGRTALVHPDHPVTARA